MAAVLQFDPALCAANAAARRAKAFGYGPVAMTQFIRRAVQLASEGLPPAVAAHQAVPAKSQRIGPTPPEAA